MLEMKLIVKGMVQGVGYRYSIIAAAEKMNLNVRGYVMNLPDGSVEILAQGNIEELKLIRKIAKEGSPRSNVREIVEEEDLGIIDAFTYNDFSIKL